MPLPSDITLVTITGTYIDYQGNSLNGTVVFTPPSFLVDAANKVSILAEPITGKVIAGALFGPDGTTALQIPATDDDSVNPTGWRYTVTERLIGAPNRPLYYISCPSSPGTVDLSTVIPEPGPASGSTQIVEGPAGPGVPVGGTAGQVLGKVDGTDFNTAWVNGGSGTGGAVAAVNGKTGNVVLSASDVGAAASNDSRLSDARTPTAHQVSHEPGGSDELTFLAAVATSGSYTDLTDTPDADVASVNSKTGTVVLNAGDVNAVPVPAGIGDGQVPAFVAATSSFSAKSILLQDTADARYAQPGDIAAQYLAIANAGAKVVVLATGDSIPAGTPIGTVIVRTGTGVNQPPVAAFSAAPSGFVGSFNASGSSDSDGTIASYFWTFGDGQNGSGSTITHTYAAAGTYSVTLTVTDNNGATNTLTKPITITGVVVASGFVAAGTPASFPTATGGNQTTTLTVPAGVTTADTVLIFSSGSVTAPAAISASGSNGGSFSTFLPATTVSNGVFFAITGTGVQAGDVITVATGSQNYRLLSHWYFHGTLTAGTPANRVSGAVTDTAPAVTVGSTQNLYAVFGDRKTGDTVSGITNASSAAITTLDSHYEGTWSPGGTANGIACTSTMAKVAAPAGASGTTTITYAIGGNNGLALHILETPR